MANASVYRQTEAGWVKISKNFPSVEEARGHLGVIRSNWESVRYAGMAFGGAYDVEQEGDDTVSVKQGQRVVDRYKVRVS
jgi:hypothetical protein